MKPRYWIVTALILILPICSYLGYLQYQKHSLATMLESKIRLANGYIIETIDTNAEINSTEFLIKIPSRVELLDRLAAETYAINDQAIPGSTEDAVNYVKACRKFLNIFAEGFKASMILNEKRLNSESTKATLILEKESSP